MKRFILMAELSIIDEVFRSRMINHHNHYDGKEPMPDEKLAERDRQLKLLLELDKARDSLQENTEPEAMFQALTRILKNHFRADACAIMLVEENNQTVELVISQGMAEDQAVYHGYQAIQMKKPDALPEISSTHTLGIQIALEKRVLGSIILTRQEQPFDQIERSLLLVAESQLDSAVIQARMIWKLAQRNRELEAIYQIDRMRDTPTTEGELINKFTSALEEYFRAEVCMVIVGHIDSGEMVLRAMVDRYGVPIEALDVIRASVEQIHMPQILSTPTGLDQLRLMAAPFIVAEERLGAVVVGRRRPFTSGDQRLIYAMMTQMDSAIIHIRTMQQLARRSRELEVIYRIDHIRDLETDFDSMLHQVLSEITHTVTSEVGFLMLYQAESEEPLELKATTVDGLLTSPFYYEVIKRFSKRALEEGKLVYSNTPDGPIRSIIAIPLILNNTIIGVFGTVNSSSPRGFSEEERRMLAAITSQVDTAVFERLERRRMRRVMSRSVDPKVLDHLLQRSDDTVLTGERVMLSAIFADLRGSTEWAERTSPEVLVNTLNVFLGRMTDVVFEFGGTLDKFVGDQVIALFGAPVHMDDHAYRAARAALAMQEAQQQAVTELAAQGLELPAMGIGVSTGEVIAGELGSTVRSDFTAIGRAMNLGSRLCGVAKAGEICISATTYEQIRSQVVVQPGDDVTLKGIGSVPFYRLLGVTEIG
jgi:adenylate cyclase